MSRVTETEINELLLLYRSGNTGAGEKLLVKLRPLVRAMVRRYANAYHEADDLEQVGYIGLMKAIDRYNPSAGTKLTTFAVKWIIGEILIYLRRGHDLIKKPAPATAQNKTKNSATATGTGSGTDTAAGTHGCTNSTGSANSNGSLKDNGSVNGSNANLASAGNLARLAALNGISPEEAAASMEYPAQCRLVFPGDEKMAAIASERSYDEEVIRKTWLKEALLSLPPEERQVIFYRYFEEKTQQQVAQNLGLSQKQVSRLEKKVLQKMKESML